MFTSGRPAPAVVIVAFHADDHLEACLAALGPDRPDVTVVDNAAAGSTAAICAAAGVAYLPAPDNAGFASAVNLGLARHPGRDVLLLNPDARLTTEGLAALQRALVSERHAAVGPRLVDEAGAAQAADWPMPSPRQVWADAVGLGARVRGPRFVTGAVLLLRAEALAELGGLDERYFLYAEEADWQSRAQRAGWTVAVVDDVTAVHVGWGSSSDPVAREERFAASGRAFARRWYGPVGAALMWLGTLAGAVRRAAVGRPAERELHRRAVRRAVRGPEPRPSARRSVVHVVRSTGFAGVESSIATIARTQHARGWRVVVVGGDQARMRERLPAGVLLLPGASSPQVLRSLWSVGRVDVVHAHMTAAEGAAAVLRRRSGGRLVVTRHFAARRGSGAATRLVGRVVARRIDVQVAISGYVADAVEGTSVVVLNAVTDAVAGGDEPGGGAGGLPPDRPRVVVVMQRHEREKETSVAIRAWAASTLPADGWRLLVHGSGSETEQLRALAAELGCTSSITFAGFTDRPRQTLAAAAVLLATAPGEPFGLSVVEAMAEGTPVVAADGGAHREALGDDGRYFSPGDVAACAAALEALAADGSRTALGERLRARQRHLFTPDRQVDGLERAYARGRAPRVVLLSLEPWDDTWRRNQHLAARVVRSGAVSSLLFLNPPRGGFELRARRYVPEPGVQVVTPPLLVPRRVGGHRVLAAWLRRQVGDADVLWVNDPVAGAGVLSRAPAAVYDVTDDWRSLGQPAADRARIVAAEDRLAGLARTVVCSRALADRWAERYGITAALISNGVNTVALRAAVPRDLPGPAPHAVYVGTLHPNRVDVRLLRALADAWPGTLHLVGPHSFEPGLVRELEAAGAALVGAVVSGDVPTWLVSADLLVCPHLVDAFTLSLDAIKAYEYLATGLPVVATPTSGFQTLTADGLAVVDADGFVAAAVAAVGTGPFARALSPDWDDRAAEFAGVLRAAAERRADPGVHR